MFSLSHLARVVYVLALSLAVLLLLEPARSPAQFGMSGGFRGTPALPTIAIPFLQSGSGSGSGSFGGIRGIGGGRASGSFSTQVNYINLNQFFPNGGRLISLPPPTFMPMMTNAMGDTSGSPFGMLSGMLMGGGLGIGGISMIGGAGIAGGGMRGMGGGMVGMGGGMMGIAGGMGMRGGMGGFAGKGMGGFNGKKAL